MPLPRLLEVGTTDVALRGRRRDAQLVVVVCVHHTPTRSCGRPVCASARAGAVVILLVFPPLPEDLGSLLRQGVRLGVHPRGSLSVPLLALARHAECPRSGQSSSDSLEHACAEARKGEEEARAEPKGGPPEAAGHPVTLHALDRLHDGAGHAQAHPAQYALDSAPHARKDVTWGPHREYLGEGMLSIPHQLLGGRFLGCAICDCRQPWSRGHLAASP
mmetsp:Transcript_92965/g.277476  ORF Transcript_92965/g.277476 Transcript_92965/m.277476 type:complete len:218 (+) Transcript_92965:1154-1807(+)